MGKLRHVLEFVLFVMFAHGWRTFQLPTQLGPAACLLAAVANFW